MSLTDLLKSAVVVLGLLVTPGQLFAERQQGSNAIGTRDHPTILAQLGGEIGDRELAKYVNSVGLSLVALTWEASEKWTFTVLDSPVVNAFALPGGYVYVTRGLLAIANNEAELAGVIGHEIGHVISAHGEDRLKRSNRAGLGVIIGTILGGVIGGQDGAADAIEFGAKLATGYLAQHSRKEELEADQIGVRLLLEAGYNPLAQADFLDQMAAKEALERKISGLQYNPNRVEFFASHPATGKRTRKAIEAAQSSGLQAEDGFLREQEYMRQIDGIIYGDTAREGLIHGSTFFHPELRFSFTVPKGFILQNSPQRVVAINDKGARIILDGDATWAGSIDRYITERWIPAVQQDVPVTNLRDVRRLRIGGQDSAMAMVDIHMPDGPKVVQLTAIRYRDTTIRLTAITARNEGRSRNALNTASQSFRALSKDEVANLRPFRLRVISVKTSDTVPSLAAAMPLDGFKEAQFRAMNGYDSNHDMRPGDLVKIVE